MRDPSPQAGADGLSFGELLPEQPLREVVGCQQLEGAQLVVYYTARILHTTKLQLAAHTAISRTTYLL